MGRKVFSDSLCVLARKMAHLVSNLYNSLTRSLVNTFFFLWLVEIFHVTKLNSFNSSLRKTVDKFVYLFYFFFWLFYYNLAVIIGTELHSASFVNDHNSHLGDLIRMMRHNCCAPLQEAIFGMFTKSLMVEPDI